MRTAAHTRTLKFGDLSPRESLQLERELATQKAHELTFGDQRRPSQQLHTRRMLALPDVMQTTDYRCGPASLRAVLTYFGYDDLCETKLARELNTCSRTGTEVDEIAQAARRRGLAAQIRERMTLGDLDAYLRRGVPVIVNYQAWRSGPTDRPWVDHWGDGHYAVVKGLNDTHVILEDPWILGRPDLIPHQEFMERWHGGENSADKRFMQGGVIIERPRGARRASERSAA